MSLVFVSKPVLIAVITGPGSRRDAVTTFNSFFKEEEEEEEEGVKREQETHSLQRHSLKDTNMNVKITCIQSF